ncbi:hypothetical protein P170DRAFT_479773 [Aspergillus steynii IBT 23096]|uniref:Myb-like DNA-binding domain-containing protein n=1 Tax=Aspergillus steynii IBT 23096 TaxID=1392250 RepID=A0A2I2FXE9_9EURO|nr:uncharacterized protein P170DRAFT_479773 [Aspergillus steynii IBT 23096]PLB45256.1 hypothetical protein P170DRAFT_479773 [Aspergillus steynii IBT 23096]
MTSNAKSTTTPEGEVSQQDAKFIVECVKNLDSNKQVDLVKVGEALGYTNVVSVANRFRLLRKRHGFPNLECTNASAKGDDKLSAATTKANGKARAATAANSGETFPESTEDGEPAASVKPSAKKKVTRRKGAKVSSKPIPASASKSKGLKTENSQNATQSQENEGINSHLLHAVDRVMKEEEQADTKIRSTRKV